MKGVLGRKTTDTTSRIIDFANSRKIRVEQKALSVAAKTREDTASVTKKHEFVSGHRGVLCAEEFR